MALRLNLAPIATIRAVLTRVGGTSVHPLIASLPGGARRTVALEVTDQICAVGAIHARVRRALVDVFLAKLARKAIPAAASKAVVTVNAAAVVAVHTETLIHVHLAMRAVEACEKRASLENM